MKGTILYLVFIFLGITSLSAQNTWYDPMTYSDEPWLCGRAWNQEIGKSYTRMPERLKSTLPTAVWTLSRQGAGLSVLFTTDATDITVKYTVSNYSPSYKNMTALNHSGVDLYAKGSDGAWHWIGNHAKYTYGTKSGDSHTFTFKNLATEKGGMLFRLLLPMYNTVTSLQIGVPTKNTFHFNRETETRPIVAYGSSILQGASPSRPGLAWTHIVQRELDFPVVNLGFSGNAFLEGALFDAMSEIDASVYIIDAIPNSNSLGDEIVNRTLAGVEKIRAKTDAPILLVEAGGSADPIFYPQYNKVYQTGNSRLKEAYDILNERGVEGIYYLTQEDIGFGEDAQIEGTHPNDIGMRCYADAYNKKLREIFKQHPASVKAVKVDADNEATDYYDALGRKVSQPSKGKIYISKGRKILKTK